jgi:hypothetical protein
MFQPDHVSAFTTIWQTAQQLSAGWAQQLQAPGAFGVFTAPKTDPILAPLTSPEQFLAA